MTKYIRFFYFGNAKNFNIHWNIPNLIFIINVIIFVKIVIGKLINTLKTIRNNSTNVGGCNIELLYFNSNWISLHIIH